MNCFCPEKSILPAVAVATVLLCSPSVFGQLPDQLPDPEGAPPDQTKPVKVYILLGQSNMLGFGKVGPVETHRTLEYMIGEKGKYPHLVDDADNWTMRNDVRYVHVTQRGDNMAVMRNEWLTPRGSFSPELESGHFMGYIHDQLVLILKACIGNRGLGWDLLPPGSDKRSGPSLTIANAQLAVSGETRKYPEFKGNVKKIDARPFWREADVSPNSRQGYHYYHNAETCMEVGDALGRAVATQLEAENARPLLPLTA